MNKSENYFDWILFAIRIVIGVILIGHGTQRILDHFFISEVHNTFGWTVFTPILCFSPIIEIIGGSLITAGIMIELGALLIIPVMFLILFISHFDMNCFTEPTNFKYILNLVMLAIAIGICGPGKWALWDPGKSFRQKIFE